MKTKPVKFVVGFTARELRVLDPQTRAQVKRVHAWAHRQTAERQAAKA